MNSTTEGGKTASSALSVRGTVASAEIPRGRSERRPKDRVPVVAVDAPEPDQLLASRQRSTLQAIRTLEQRHGCSPVLREIGKAVGLASVSSVSYQFSILEHKGHLKRAVWTAAHGRRVPTQPATHRAGARPGPKAPMSIVTPEMVYVPLVGRIAAGRRPFVIDESIEDTSRCPGN